MNKTFNIAFLILGLACLLMSCTKEKPRPTARAIQIITDTYYVYEPNPLYLNEAKKINELFRHALINRNTLKSDERQKIYSMAVAAYEAYDESALEDAVDEARMMMQKSLSMATAAVVGKPEVALKCFETAKVSLNRDDRTDALMEDQYSALLILELLYLSEHKMLKEIDKEGAIITMNKFTHLPKRSKDIFIELVKGF